MGKKEKFIEELLKYSTSKTIESAKEEWNVISVKNNDGKCICGQALSYSITMQNNINENIITVGGDCINKFISNNLGVSIIKCYGKIRKNKYSLLTDNVLQYLVEKEIINEAEKEEYVEDKKNWNSILATNSKFMLSLIDEDDS